ncbi:MAG TPA: BCAM0308 family protein [Myxococcota bacterium]|nr:BCAM0308 family protein [Myxococcota bacterium]
MKSKQPKKEKAGRSGGKMQPSRSDAHADPYRSKRKHVETKLAEPTVCSSCGAVYHEGRWTWPRVKPATGAPTLCPACHRIRDNEPLGEVRIAGAFAAEHRDEILARVRHVEEREKKEHPLLRLMGVRDEGGEIVVTTTDPHLAHAIGTALKAAFKGELHSPWSEAGELMRVRWER